MKKLMLMLTVLSCFTATYCSNESLIGSETETLPNDVILEWNQIAYHAYGGETYQHSLMASRINAMVHIAMHDALNAIHPVYARYALTETDPEANPVAAAASAAHVVLLHEIPEKKNYLDSALQQTLSGIPESNAKNKGVELGKAAGQAILADRANDGASADPISPIPPSTITGVYQAVPPFEFIFAPFWQDVKLFGLQRKDQFRVAPNPATSSQVYAQAYAEVKEVGRLDSQVRTADQTSYAHYWYEFSEAGWNRVVRIVAENKKLNLWETARLFALVDIAMADAYIAGWDSKFHYNFWRPYTAIRRAHLDDNALTSEDLQWEPEMVTPPVQDYPSTHSALGNAAATVLAEVLGNHTSFKMWSPTALPGQEERSFTGFLEAADENADSRVMAGIHFRFAIEAGQDLGNKVGKWVADHHLRPMK